MDSCVLELGNFNVLVLDASNDLPAATVPNDLIGVAWEHEVEIVAVPTSCLPEKVFELRSGLLGELAQKAANYRIRLVIVGDVSRYLAASKAFHDYVYETNTGLTLWFVPDMAVLETRLTS
ncbi:DUF4180 domain-containing protein [Pelagibacterium sp.]|uniref:DUF4180 domain-containing protein n=1 Tax=Pelagibacterium sp. TaxID=1967288 RepID=UPI003A9376A1